MKARKMFGFWLVVLMSLPVAAVPVTVTMDLSGLGETEFELEISLVNKNGVSADSIVLLDNVSYGTTFDDFEDGTAGGFLDLNSPGVVSVISGSLDTRGCYVLHMTEDPVLNPSILLRNYTPDSATALSFHMDFMGDAAGQDQLLFSLRDSFTLDPLLPGIDGRGMVLAVDSQGVTRDDIVTLIPVPEPGSMLLLGLGGLLLRRRSNPA